MCQLWIWSHHRRIRSTWQKGVEMALFLENWLTQGCIVDHLYLLELDVRDFGVCGSNHLPSLLSYDQKNIKKVFSFFRSQAIALYFLWMRADDQVLWYYRDDYKQMIRPIFSVQVMLDMTKAMTSYMSTSIHFWNE